jgi:hypothetical protein
MSTQTERKRDTPATTIGAGELKASDFFPPGTGWNKAPREIRDLDLEKRGEEEIRHGNRH